MRVLAGVDYGFASDPVALVRLDAAFLEMEAERIAILNDTDLSPALAAALAYGGSRVISVPHLSEIPVGPPRATVLGEIDRDEACIQPGMNDEGNTEGCDECPQFCGNCSK